MACSNRLFTIFVALIVSSLLLIGYTSNLHKASRWQDLSQNVGMGEWVERYRGKYSASISSSSQSQSSLSDSTKTPRIEFKPGTPKPAGSNYTKTLVVPRTSEESVEWMDAELPDDIQRAVYVVDDPKAPLHPPKNKGHEVMVYLTYIIDHYDDLPDIALFMHAHQAAWHNADIFDLDGAEMIRRLSAERVVREGYMNMRCQWSPGCPDWMHPGETTEDPFKTEEVLIAKAWAELFPLDHVPEVLATPCCAQFAVSRQRMQAIPKATYVYYRDWLLHTPLKDFVSGRVWEYMWQYVFTGESSLCPVEHICYCDGFGVCFGDEATYNSWWEIRNERDGLNGAWLDWEAAIKKWNGLLEEGRSEAEIEQTEDMQRPAPGKDQEYGARIDTLQKEMDRLLREAKERGRDPRLRAVEAGRRWSEGDGF